MGGPKPREARHRRRTRTGFETTPTEAGAGRCARTPPCRRGRRHHLRPCCWACSPRDWATCALNWQAYADSPASVIDIRDGGWNLWIGLVAGLAWLLRLGWRAPALRPALAAGASVGLLMWGMGLLMQQRAASPPATRKSRWWR
jgi:hypothetical protein